MNDPVRDTPLLFTPIQLRSVLARNRIVSSPMCQYASDDGGPEEWQLVNFGRFAMGGCGIVFGEESAVEARGRNPRLSEFESRLSVHTEEMGEWSPSGPENRRRFGT